MRRNEYIISLLTIIAKTDTSEIPYNYLVDSLEECDFEMAFNYLGYDPRMVCEGYGISSLDELTNKEIAKDIREILEELA